MIKSNMMYTTRISDRAMLPLKEDMENAEGLRLGPVTALKL